MKRQAAWASAVIAILSVLPCSVFFDKNPRVVQGAIVAHKRLGAVLGKIRRDQQERDRQRLARRSLTNLQKSRIRSAAGTS